MDTDFYVQHLIMLAYTSDGVRSVSFGQCCWFGPVDGFFATSDGPGHAEHCQFGPTLADALAALLTVRGVTVPERPSAERVARWESPPPPSARVPWNYLRDLYAREPLTVLALLEGGAA